MLAWCFVIYASLSAILLAVLYRRSFREWLVRWIIVTVFPLIGWLLPMFWPRSWYRHAEEKFEHHLANQEEELKLEHVGVYQVPETNQELNVIPIEDALMISEHHTRRRVMIDLLKEDAIHHLDILQIAVRNEDTETSHYAVSALMEVKRNLLTSIQDLSVKYEQDKQDEYLAQTYAEVLRNYLKSGFLDERTLMKYRFTYLDVLSRLVEIGEHAIDYFKAKIELELELDMYPIAEATSQQFIARYPLEEDAYLAQMKVYYTLKSESKLHETLNLLKSSPINLSNHALTMVRFWSESARI